MKYPVGLAIAAQFVKEQSETYGEDSPQHIAAMKHLIATTKRLGCTAEALAECVFDCYAGFSINP